MKLSLIVAMDRNGLIGKRLGVTRESIRRRGQRMEKILRRELAAYAEAG